MPNKYADFANVFLPKLAIELPEHMRIHNHTIKLVNNWLPPYTLIYSLGLVELDILNAYINNNLANSFIKLFKSPARALILFDKKPDGSIRLCIDYQDLNNLTIKNLYLLFLVRESLSQLGQARRFTQLYLTNAYY